MGQENSPNIMLLFLKINKSQSPTAKAKAICTYLSNLDLLGQRPTCLEGPGWPLEWSLISRRP